MKKIAITTLGAALIALSVADVASAAERHQARRHHVRQPAVTISANPRNAFDYYPAQGRATSAYGVYPGLVEGGAISAPAGR